MRRDAKVDEAKEALTKFFEEKSEEVFYMKQLEVLFEGEFFHWIKARAISELIEENALGSERVPLQKSTEAMFVFNRRHRYYKRQIRERIEIVRQYAGYEIATACGRQAEVLFLNALASRGFVCEGNNINEYRGKKWEKTNHNLDWIMAKDNIAYGCEVKNKWDYIELDELTVKLDICEFLDVKPLFIMRHSPKTYNNEIIIRGGYAMIFVSQIYPFAHSGLVRKIVDVLGLPADSPRAIPDGIIDRFMNWHNKSIS